MAKSTPTQPPKPLTQQEIAEVITNLNRWQKAWQEAHDKANDPNVPNGALGRLQNEERLIADGMKQTLDLMERRGAKLTLNSETHNFEQAVNPGAAVVPIAAVPTASPTAPSQLDKVGHLINNSKIILQRGSKGEGVTELQNAINRYNKQHGLQEIGVDGTFGGETQRAIQRFQQDHGATLPPSRDPRSADGKVGKITLDMMVADHLGDAPSPAPTPGVQPTRSGSQRPAK